MNTLGGGKDDKCHWPQREIFQTGTIVLEMMLDIHTIQGIELIQYSIMNHPSVSVPVGMSDWLTFLTRGHRLTTAEVMDTIMTSGV